MKIKNIELEFSHLLCDMCDSDDTRVFSLSLNVYCRLVVHILSHER